ncbi:uncharacterized protein V6R79_001095 [Siganus canaliculatus]
MNESATITLPPSHLIHFDLSGIFRFRDDQGFWFRAAGGSRHLLTHSELQADTRPKDTAGKRSTLKKRRNRNAFKVGEYEYTLSNKIQAEHVPLSNGSYLRRGFGLCHRLFVNQSALVDTSMIMNLQPHYRDQIQISLL